MTDILSSNGGAATAAAATTSYEPRQSARVRGANIHTTGDGDVWQEHLVVCEAAGNKLVIRSYFKNSRTKKKVWDEPPTGASSIEPASPDKRTEAEGELKTLQAAMDGVSADANPDNNNGGSENGGKKSKKSRGFFGAFRKKGSKNGPGTTANAKTGGMFSKRGSSSNNGKKADDFGVDGDEDIQRAISLSMGLQNDTVASSQQTAYNKYSKKKEWQEDQEALEMAKAISMSEADANGHGVQSESPTTATVGAVTTTTTDNTNESTTEEEMLQRAIEESRREHANNGKNASLGAGAMPSTQEADLLRFSATGYDPGPMHQAQQQRQQSFPFHQQENQDFRGHHSPMGNGEFLDNQKMPAKAANLKKPPPTAGEYFPNDTACTPSFAAAPAVSNTMAFDPYAQSTSAMPPTAGGSYPQGDSVNDGPVLRKMDEQGDRKPAASLGRLMYNKKSVEDEAGVV